MKNIAFFGTPQFTVDFLNTLTEKGYAPTLVVTNPDRAIGRGMIVTAPAPKVWANENNISVIQPEKMDADIVDYLSQTKWDLFVVVAYGKILPEVILSMPSLGTINVHYSLLPKYRGATPVESAIQNGDTVTGVSIQQMRYKLDSGPILAEYPYAIERDDTTLTLRDKLNVIALQELPKMIEALFSGAATPKEQDESLATHTTKITKADGEISLSDDPLIIDRSYRAHVGNVGTYFYTEKNGTPIRVKVVSAHLEQNNFTIDEVIPENGKRQSYQQFLAS